MDAGTRALASGFVAFVIGTAVAAIAGERRRDSSVDALTVGGVVGGAVALVVWIASEDGDDR